MRKTAIKSSVGCSSNRGEEIHECVPQGADELAEAGPAGRLVGPAAGEQGVDGGRALLRLGKSNSQLQLVDHLPVL